MAIAAITLVTAAFVAVKSLSVGFLVRAFQEFGFPNEAYS